MGVGGWVEVVDEYGEGVVDVGVVVEVQVVSGQAVLLGAELGFAAVREGGGAGLEGLGVAVRKEDLDGEVHQVGLVFRVGGLEEVVTVRVGGCGVGTGAMGEGGGGDGGVLVCGVCGEGTYSDEVGVGACRPINPCPFGSVAGSVGGNASRAPDCVCDAGFVYEEGVSTEIVCKPCPTGGVCERGGGGPEAAPGFAEIRPGVFAECLRPEACALGQCREGTQGYMCNECAEGWYTDGVGACRECGGGERAGFGLVIVGLVVVVGAGVGGVVASVEGGGAGEGGVARLRKRRVPGSLAIAVGGVQVMALVGNGRFRWGGEGKEGGRTSKVLEVLMVSNVDASALGMGCVMEDFWVRYVVGVVGWVAVVVAVGLGVMGMSKVRPVLAAKLAEGGWGGWRRVVEGVLFTIGPQLYIPIARATLVVFDCTRLPNGKYVLDADPGVECFDGAWWGAVWLGVVVVLGFVVGLPVFYGSALWVRRGKLLEQATFSRFGSLYKLYRVKMWWGGVSDLVRRLLMVCVSVFLSQHVWVQLAGFLTVISVAGYVSAVRQPYYYPLYNRLEFTLGAAAGVLALLGGAAYGGAEEGVVFGLVIVLLVAVAGVVGVGVVVDGLDVWRAVKDGGAGGGRVRVNVLVKKLEDEVGDLEEGVGGVVGGVVEELKRVGGGVELEEVRV